MAFGVVSSLFFVFCFLVGLGVVPQLFFVFVFLVGLGVVFGVRRGSEAGPDLTQSGSSY